jgi:hypothetical protein
MFKLLWFIPQPQRDIENFEDWYQSEHVVHGMRQELLQRFRISRSFYPQPEFVVSRTGSEKPIAYRFSEGYWQTVDDMRRCYVSPNGRAALADGPVNIRPAAAPPPVLPVLIVEEEVLPVQRELGFNVREGLYQAPQACKLFAFVRLKGDAQAFDRDYLALADKASKDPDLRGHVLGRTQNEVVRIGRVMQWPPLGAEHFDRTLEYYFESREAMDRFCASPWMKEVTALVDRATDGQAWDAAQMQEVFYTSAGDQPLEDSWKALYAPSGELRA